MSSKAKKKAAVLLPDFNLREVEGKTLQQKRTIQAFSKGYNLLLHGTAGTGKSFLAMWLSLKEILAGKYSKLILIRSSVPARNSGFLPGDHEEKAAIFEPPYINICTNLFNRKDAYETLKTREFIDFQTTSYLRGLTFDDAIIFADEIQNYNYQELRTVITRAGNNSKFIFAGDFYQNDLYRNLNDQSGVEEFMDVIDLMPEFELIEFGPEDIVRGGICKSFILSELQLAEEEGSASD